MAGASFGPARLRIMTCLPAHGARTISRAPPSDNPGTRGPRRDLRLAALNQSADDSADAAATRVLGHTGLGSGRNRLTGKGGDSGWWHVCPIPFFVMTKTLPAR